MALPRILFGAPREGKVRASLRHGDTQSVVVEVGFVVICDPVSRTESGTVL